MTKWLSSEADFRISLAGALALMASMDVGSALAQSSPKTPVANKQLTEAICESNDTPSWQALLKSGFHGARARAQILAGTETKLYSDELSRRLGAKLGVGRDLASTISGQCSNGKRWILASSGVDEAFRIRPKDLLFDVQKLRTTCNLNSGRYVRHAGGKSRLIKLPDSVRSELTVNSGFLDPGVLIIMCRYIGDASKRIRPMFQFQIGSPEPEIPQGSTFSQQDSAANLFLNWINSVRGNEQLKPLELIAVTSAAEKVMNDTKPHHRVIINSKEMATALSFDKLFFNGVMASYGFDPKEAAWGFWNTPEFRDRILDKKIKSVMIGTKQNAGQLAIYIFSFDNASRD